MIGAPKNKVTNPTLHGINSTLSIEDSSLQGKPVTSQTYNTDYTLEPQHQQFAIAYEVAKRTGCSLAEATEKYTVIEVSLDSIQADYGQQKEAIHFALENTTSKKPTVLMVNYSVGGTKVGWLKKTPHWAPIIISRDEEGNYQATSINSKTSLLYKTEFSDFQEELVFGLNSSRIREIKSIQSIDASRNVQRDNICGFASADAAGIAISALAKTGGIDSNINKAVIEAPDYHTKHNPKTSKASYMVQGQRTFAVMEYLKSLDEQSRKVTMEKPIFELEKEALIQAGFLSKKQAQIIQNDQMLDQFLVFKYETKNAVKNMSKDAQIQLYDEILANQ